MPRTSPSSRGKQLPRSSREALGDGATIMTRHVTVAEAVPYVAKMLEHAMLATPGVRVVQGGAVFEL